MARKPFDLPMNVAEAFVKDLRAYHAETDAVRRDEIAARQLDALQEFQGPREKKLRLTDVHDMFERMRDLLDDDGKRH